MTLGDLRRDLARGKEWPALDEALARLVAAGEVRRTEHGFVWAEAAAEPDAGQGESMALLLAQFEAAPVPAETPSVAVVAEAAGLPPRDAQKIVDALVRQGKLVRVGEDLYYPPDRLQALLDQLAGAMEAAGQMTLAEARDLLGTSRRYAQALLEHMDSEGLTLRVGEARRLRRRRRR